MQPGTFNDTVAQGATWSRQLTLASVTYPTSGGTIPASSTPLDLTGWEARLEVRSRERTTAPLLVSISEVASADGVIVLTPLTGDVSITVSPAATARFLRTTVYYDLFFELPGLIDGVPDVRKYLRGQLTVGPSVTDPSYDPD